jgi:hypothetical protein
MREILFRGKLIDKYQNAGSWQYGSLLRTVDGVYHIFSLPSFTFEVDACTVGLYSGYDDVAEHPIFDNDIVVNRKGSLWLVKYSGRVLGWKVYPYNGGVSSVERGRWMHNLVHPKMNLRVVGNVFDTPRLLGRKEKVV